MGRGQFDAGVNGLNTKTDHYKVYSPKNFAASTFMQVIYLRVRRFLKSLLKFHALRLKANTVKSGGV